LEDLASKVREVHRPTTTARRPSPSSGHIRAKHWSPKPLEYLRHAVMAAVIARRQVPCPSARTSGRAGPDRSL